MGIRVDLQNVRVAWQSIFKANKSSMYPNNPAKFGISVILDPKVHSKEIAAINEAIQHTKASAFPNGACGLPVSWTPKPDGTYHLRAASAEDRKPWVVDRSTKIIFDPAAIYAGCYVNVAIDVYPSVANRKICVGILGVQFVADGERIDNRPAAEELFKPLEVTGSQDSGFNPLG